MLSIQSMKKKIYTRRRFLQPATTTAELGMARGATAQMFSAPGLQVKGRMGLILVDAGPRKNASFTWDKDNQKKIISINKRCNIQKQSSLNHSRPRYHLMPRIFY